MELLEFDRCVCECAVTWWLVVKQVRVLDSHHMLELQFEKREKNTTHMFQFLLYPLYFGNFLFFPIRIKWISVEAAITIAVKWINSKQWHIIFIKMQFALARKKIKITQCCLLNSLRYLVVIQLLHFFVPAHSSSSHNVIGSKASFELNHC